VKYLINREFKKKHHYKYQLG